MKEVIIQRVYTLSDIFAKICKGAYYLSWAFVLIIFGRLAMLFIMDLYGLY